MSASSCRWLVASFAASIALTSSAQAARVPPPLRVAIILKALGYDQAVARHKGGELRVAVVALKGDATSEEVASTTLAELGRMAGRQIAGLKLSAAGVMLRRGDDAAAVVGGTRANVIYLSVGVEAFAKSLSELARRTKALIVSGEEHHAKGPAGLVVVLRGAKPKIIVNLGEARAQGAQFDARLLRLAEVIK